METCDVVTAHARISHVTLIRPSLGDAGNNVVSLWSSLSLPDFVKGRISNRVKVTERPSRGKFKFENTKRDKQKETSACSSKMCGDRGLSWGSGETRTPVPLPPRMRCAPTTARRIEADEESKRDGHRDWWMHEDA